MTTPKTMPVVERRRRRLQKLAAEYTRLNEAAQRAEGRMVVAQEKALLAWRAYDLARRTKATR